MLYLETNDGYRSPAYILNSIKLPSGSYVFFFTMDDLGRPTARVASSESYIVESELGARLVWITEDEHEAQAALTPPT
jgi:hypothetical protein